MPRKTSRILTSLLLLETPCEKLAKSHKIQDHGLLQTSYKVNSRTNNLNKYKLKTSRRINDNALSSKLLSLNARL
jgi:hypothetical protein